MAGHLALCSPVWGDNWFPRTMFGSDKAHGMADPTRPSVSNCAPDLAVTQSNTLLLQLPSPRRRLSRHMLCWLSRSVDFCEGSSSFSGHLRDAGEWGLLPHPNAGPWALGGLHPAPGILAGGQGSLSRALNLLRRNGGACKPRGGIGPPEFTAPTLGLGMTAPATSHTSASGLGCLPGRLIQCKKK